MIIQRECVVCKKRMNIKINVDDYMDWKRGIPLRELTDLSEDEISLLCTNECSSCREMNR